MSQTVAPIAGSEQLDPTQASNYGYEWRYGFSANNWSVGTYLYPRYIKFFLYYKLEEYPDENTYALKYNLAVASVDKTGISTSLTKEISTKYQTLNIISGQTILNNFVLGYTKAISQESPNMYLFPHQSSSRTPNPNYEVIDATQFSENATYDFKVSVTCSGTQSIYLPEQTLTIRNLNNLHQPTEIPYPQIITSSVSGQDNSVYNLMEYAKWDVHNSTIDELTKEVLYYNINEEPAWPDTPLTGTMVGTYWTTFAPNSAGVKSSQNLQWLESWKSYLGDNNFVTVYVALYTYEKDKTVGSDDPIGHRTANYIVYAGTRVPVQPTITDPSITESNTVLVSHVGQSWANNNIFSGLSKPTVTWTAEARNGATISSLQLQSYNTSTKARDVQEITASHGQSTYTASYTYNPTKYNRYLAYIFDSRGQTELSSSVTKTLVNYESPKINIDQAHVTSDGYITFISSVTWTPRIYNNFSNIGRARVYWKPTSSSTWQNADVTGFSYTVTKDSSQIETGTTYNNIFNSISASATANSTTYKINGSIQITGWSSASLTTHYDVKIEFYEDLQTDGSTPTWLEFVLPQVPCKPVFDFDQDDITINVDTKHTQPIYMYDTNGTNSAELAHYDETNSALQIGDTSHQTTIKAKSSKGVVVDSKLTINGAISSTGSLSGGNIVSSGSILATTGNVSAATINGKVLVQSISEATQVTKHCIYYKWTSSSAKTAQQIDVTWYVHKYSDGWFEAQSELTLTGHGYETATSGFYQSEFYYIELPYAVSDLTVQPANSAEQVFSFFDVTQDRGQSATYGSYSVTNAIKMRDFAFSSNWGVNKTLSFYIRGKIST